MNKLMIALVAAVSLFTVAGCKKKGGGNDAMVKMEGFQKAMCDCKDKACADKVQEDMTKWGTEAAKNAKADEKPDPDMVKKSGEIMTKYTECMTKLMTASMSGGSGSAAEPPKADGSGSAAEPPKADGSGSAAEPPKADGSGSAK